MSNSPKYRGRLQAQGGGLEESESWASDNPPTLKEGLSMLEKLKNKLSKKEQNNRQELFEKAEHYIMSAGEKDGVDAPVKKTFLKKGSRDVRVDIEVILGVAFVAGILLLIFIIIL